MADGCHTIFIFILPKTMQTMPALVRSNQNEMMTYARWVACIERINPNVFFDK